MPELINKAKLLEYLAAIKPDEYVSAYGEAAVDVINHVETYVSAMPTIEAEPVRHGRWMKQHTDYGSKWHCSVCCIIPIRVGIGISFEIERFAFCPFCGARMDGGAENDDIL